MPSDKVLKEADRVMVICNACRYCEGFCAVFPAMERRRTFEDQDLKYLANLCHNCRDCYYACQYAPPHEYQLNVPRALAELRLETYRDAVWPGVFAGLIKHNGPAVASITVLSIAAVLLLTIVFSGPPTVFSTHLGENAFYRVIPYALMVIPFSSLAIYLIIVFLIGLNRFWRDAAGKPADFTDFRANGRALWDALRLKYLAGGGYGCNYPDERFSHIRRWLHHCVFYGFLLCLTSTTVAAIYDHFLHRPAPYPVLSWPVVLGTIGGVALLVGSAGLLYLKARMDSQPATPRSLGMDIGFLVLLFLTSLSGLLLLILRETPAMGTLLAVHLGIVMGLFVTMPYGKFIHAIFRYAALVKNAHESLREDNSR
jgi:citrate/tricarballylate utilization protein